MADPGLLAALAALLKGGNTFGGNTFGGNRYGGGQYGGNQFGASAKPIVSSTPGTLAQSPNIIPQIAMPEPKPTPPIQPSAPAPVQPAPPPPMQAVSPPPVIAPGDQQATTPMPTAVNINGPGAGGAGAMAVPQTNPELAKWRQMMDQMQYARQGQ